MKKFDEWLFDNLTQDYSLISYEFKKLNCLSTNRFKDLNSVIRMLEKIVKLKICFQQIRHSLFKLISDTCTVLHHEYICTTSTDSFLLSCSKTHNGPVYSVDSNIASFVRDKLKYPSQNKHFYIPQDKAYKIMSIYKKQDRLNKLFYKLQTFIDRCAIEYVKCGININNNNRRAMKDIFVIFDIANKKCCVKISHDFRDYFVWEDDINFPDIHVW